MTKKEATCFVRMASVSAPRPRKNLASPIIPCPQPKKPRACPMYSGVHPFELNCRKAAKAGTSETPWGNNSSGGNYYELDIQTRVGAVYGDGELNRRD